MHCPLHADTVLETRTVEPGVTVRACPRCGGYWMTAAAYWQWREGLSEPLPDLEVEDGGEDEVSDSAGAKLCPVDGGFLIRHQVGHGLGFWLDRCGRCGGVWLDRGEWEALERRQMHDDLHLIFTSTWQTEVRRQRKARADEKRLIERLGDADYRRAKEINAWLESKGRDSSADTLGPILGLLVDGLSEIIR
ncbi:MAG: zf-TFIIB domain-containing protein [Planctomycetota bacterium]